MKLVGVAADATENNHLAVDADGRAYVLSPAKISTLNSTTTPLAAAAEYTGTWERVADYAEAVISVRADVASAASGLIIEKSIDGISETIDDDDKYTIGANRGRVIGVGTNPAWFRVRYINGAAPQTSFRLQTAYKIHRTKPSSHRLGDDIDDENDGELVIATLRGKDQNGLFRQARILESGGILVENASLSTPPDTARVEQVAYSSVATSADLFYPITNGKTLVMQRLSAGAEASTAGTVVELWEDPNGDGSVLNIIEALFASGDASQVSMGAEFVGNGTRRILLRRLRLDGGAKRIFGRWEGYEK